MNKQQVKTCQKTAINLLKACAINDIYEWDIQWQKVDADQTLAQFTTWLIFISFDNIGNTRIFSGPSTIAQLMPTSVMRDYLGDPNARSVNVLIGASERISLYRSGEEWNRLWNRKGLDHSYMAWCLAGLAFITRQQYASSFPKTMRAMRRSINNAYRYQGYRRLRSRIRATCHSVQQKLHIQIIPYDPINRIHIINLADYPVPHFDLHPHPLIQDALFKTTIPTD